jgi:hypothetical protein
MKFSGSSIDASAVARRDNMVLNGRPGSIITITKSGSIALSTGYASVSFDLATYPAYQSGSVVTLTCSGTLSAITGGTANAISVLVQSPDGVTLTVPVLVAQSDSGFQFSVTTTDPALSAFFLYFQLTTTTGSPVATVSNFKVVATQPPQTVKRTQATIA